MAVRLHACPACGGAGERQRPRGSKSVKERKKDQRREKHQAAAARLQQLVGAHPAVSACRVTWPTAPGELPCAHIVWELEAGGAPGEGQATARALDDILAAGGSAPSSKVFPGGVFVLASQAGLAASVASAGAGLGAEHKPRPWLPCTECDASGLQQRELPPPASMLGPAVAGVAGVASSDARPLIAVVGGGIGGAAVALALQQRGMRVVVFERDASFSSRRQGYGLTMQQGGTALTRLGLQPEGISSSSHFVFNPAGQVLGFFGRALQSPTACSNSCSPPAARPKVRTRLLPAAAAACEPRAACC